MTPKLPVKCQGGSEDTIIEINTRASNHLQLYLPVRLTEHFFFVCKEK